MRPQSGHTPARIAIAPPHPGAFIREEILNELGLSVSEAAKVLDVRRATLSDLATATVVVGGNGAAVEKAFGNVTMETMLNYVGHGRMSTKLKVWPLSAAVG